MRQFEILFLFILGFAVSILASSVSPNAPSLPTTNNFSIVPSGTLIPCSICRLFLNRNDLYRQSCRHGYHFTCLHRIHALNQDRLIFDNFYCQDCKKHNTYAAFLTHQIFISPDLAQALAFILPGKLDVNFMFRFWRKALIFPTSVALARLMMYQMPWNIWAGPKYQPFDLLSFAAIKATPGNLNFFIKYGPMFGMMGFCEKEALFKGFVVALKTHKFDNAVVFLQRGLNINYKRFIGQSTALIITIKNENTKAVQFLLTTMLI